MQAKEKALVLDVKTVIIKREGRGENEEKGRGSEDKKALNTSLSKAEYADAYSEAASSCFISNSG